MTVLARTASTVPDNRITLPASSGWAAALDDPPPAGGLEAPAAWQPDSVTTVAARRAAVQGNRRCEAKLILKIRVGTGIQALPGARNWAQGPLVCDRHRDDAEPGSVYTIVTE